MERIEIKNFLDIKDISIEVKQINILIGSQASGKSVIAKLLYYFKSFVFETINIVERSPTKESLNKNYRQKFKKYFPSSSWGNNSFTIKYFINNESIEIKRKSFDIELSYSGLYKDSFDKFVSLVKGLVENQSEPKSKQSLFNFALPSISLHEVRTAFLQKISEDIDYRISFTQRYIPAGRAFFANLEKNIFFLLSKNTTIEPFLIEFGLYYEQIKAQISSESTLRDENENLRDRIKEISYKIVCGKYLQKNDGDYLELENNRQVNILNSSSGQQETLPLTLILRVKGNDQPFIGGDSIYIEEPEAHIFPSTQKDIVELIATVYNARKDSSQFFLTTHSPYILTAFNNLLQAGILAVDATEEKIEEIDKLVSKTKFLNPKEMAVYSVENGYCKSIMDEETGLIDANVIDEVSNELAVQFDKLLDLEE